MVSSFREPADFEVQLERLERMEQLGAYRARPRSTGPHVPVTISLADAYEFEAAWKGPHSAVKEEKIRARFGCPAARYYQILNRHIDSPEGLLHDPQLTRRLRDQRDERAARRADRTTFTIRKART